MTADELSKRWPVKPVHPVQQFRGIEQQLRFSLPPDFKDLLRVFGSGGFGELHLFHPNSPVEMLRLPQAVFDAHALFQIVEQYLPEHFPAEPSENCVVLGMLLPRTYLIWGVSSGWRLFDSEMSRFSVLGENLPRFLDEAYRLWLSPDSSARAKFSRELWGDFDPANQTPLFTPALERA